MTQLALCCALGACSPTHDPTPEGVPLSLTPLGGATDIKFTESDEGSGIFYRVAGTSRSRRLPSELSRQLGNGWTPKRLQLRDLGLPKDEVGWADISDDDAGIEGYYWSTEWENAEGDELFYSMTYITSLPDGVADPAIGNVEVYAWITPSALVSRPCDLGTESPDLPPAVVQADLLVLRRISDSPSDNRRQSATLFGAVYYFDRAEAVLGGGAFLRDAIQALDQPPYPGAEATVLLCLTETGRSRLEDWTRDNIARRLGFFVAGELTYAPLVNSVLRDGVLRLPAPTLKEARLIRQHLISRPPGP